MLPSLNLVVPINALITTLLPALLNFAASSNTSLLDCVVSESRIPLPP
jgi:hypothetical protein